MKGMTLHTHRVSVALMGVAVLVATADGFAQSYSGLYHWGLEHGLSGWKAQSFPLMVDLFILVGELGLFTLALEGHKLTKSGMAWADLALPTTIATAGWGVSLAFNVGTHQKLADQLTAAVPPVASMLGLLVLLRTLHRVISRGVWEHGDQVTVHGEPHMVHVGREPVHGPVGYELWDVMPPAVEAGDDPGHIERDVQERQGDPVTLATEVRRRSGRSTRDRIADYMADHPHAAVAEIAREIGVSESTAKRHRRDLRATTEAHDPPGDPLATAMDTEVSA